MFLLISHIHLLNCNMAHNPDDRNVILYYHGKSYILHNSYCSGVIDVLADPHGVGELQITQALLAVSGNDGCMGHCPYQGVRLHASLE